jgi:2-polyprenyl-3-methyl-5-hydroxy-6-metoxy-1,4-benzoquinol methylase
MFMSDTVPPSELDLEVLKRTSFAVFSQLSGAVTAAMIHLGDRLGLYRALASGPVTSVELAARTELHERWVREWLANQTAAQLIHSHDGVFHITPEAAAVLADDSHAAFGMGWFQRLPETLGVMSQLGESFRTGLGLTYDVFGDGGAAGIERAFEPWYRNALVSDCLPLLDGVVAKLQAGARVADVGCGGGVAVELLAETYANSSIAGYEISEFALDRAGERIARLPNASVHHAAKHPLPSDGSLDLVCMFDVLHDLAHPTEMVAAIYESLKPDGTWLLVDIKARNTVEENVAKNPMAAMMYGISVLCCMSSAMSEPDGEGLGTLGLSAERAESMARAAGFTRFRVLPVQHSINAFYEIRP